MATGRGWIRGRGGKLFDPERFLSCRARTSHRIPPSPATVSDGCILRILDLLLSLDGERLSYRTLDVEQIGSVYETVMGFTVETRPGPALAIRAGKNDRTPVFVDMAALTATKGAERAKFLKEEADRNALADKVGKALAAATDAAGLIAALSPIVDERGSPGGQVAPPGTPLLQPTDERRRTGSHYTPRSLTEPIVQHALEPAFERIGHGRAARGRAGAEGLRPGDGLRRFPRRGLPRARRAAGAGLGALARDAAEDPGGRGRASPRPPARRAALPLRRRQEPARRRTRASCRCGSRRSRATTNSLSSTTR